MSSLMSAAHKKALLVNRRKCLSMTVSTNLLAPLLANRSLTDDMAQKIMRESLTRHEKSAMLLDYLATRSELAFETFIEALVYDDQPEIAILLDAELAKFILKKKQAELEVLPDPDSELAHTEQVSDAPDGHMDAIVTAAAPPVATVYPLQNVPLTFVSPPQGTLVVGPNGMLHIVGLNPVSAAEMQASWQAQSGSVGGMAIPSPQAHGSSTVVPTAAGYLPGQLNMQPPTTLSNMSSSAAMPIGGMQITDQNPTSRHPAASSAISASVHLPAASQTLNQKLFAAATESLVESAPATEVAASAPVSVPPGATVNRGTAEDIPDSSATDDKQLLDDDVSAEKLLKDFFEAIVSEKPSLQFLLDSIKKSRKVKGDESIAVYPMSCSPHGRVIIINIEFFLDPKPKPPDGKNVHLATRDGTNHDAANLEAMFKKFGYEVIVEHNKTKDDIEKIVVREQKLDHTVYDAFIFVILSHGTEGCFYTRDGEEMSIQWLTDEFDGDKCPSLSDKPKIFLIQACQGDKIARMASDGPHRTDSGDGDLSEAECREMRRKLHADGTVPEAGSVTKAAGKTHPKADFLVVYATAKRYAAWRYRLLGSCFIRSLVFVVSRFAHEKHLLDLIVLTNRLMSTLKADDDGEGPINLIGESSQSLTRDINLYADLDRK